MYKNANKTSVSWYDVTHDGNIRRITIPKRPINLYFLAFLWHNLLKFVTKTGLYCSKQLKTTFNQFGKKIVAYRL